MELFALISVTVIVSSLRTRRQQTQWMHSSSLTGIDFSSSGVTEKRIFLIDHPNRLILCKMNQFVADPSHQEISDLRKPPSPHDDGPITPFPGFLGHGRGPTSRARDDFGANPTPN
jgi:hypothetical protein